MLLCACLFSMPQLRSTCSACSACRALATAADLHVQVKLFTDFYQSDVIVASPLAIATRIADERDDGVDFLSSIEVAILLRADFMLMQNWSHVEATMASLNQMPKQQHDVDIMRVRHVHVCILCLHSASGPWGHARCERHF